MARPKKVIKRVSLTVQADMSDSQLKQFKADLIQSLEGFLPGQLVYVAIDSETRD